MKFAKWNIDSTEEEIKKVPISSQLIVNNFCGRLSWIWLSLIKFHWISLNPNQLNEQLFNFLKKFGANGRISFFWQFVSIYSDRSSILSSKTRRAQTISSSLPISTIIALQIKKRIWSNRNVVLSSKVENTIEGKCGQRGSLKENQNNNAVLKQSYV